MNAKTLAIRHGEKLLCALFVLISAWVLYDVFTDPGIRPKDATSEDVTLKLHTVEDKRATSMPPNMQPAPQYASEVAKRWAEQVEKTDPLFMTWLNGPIDTGPKDADKMRFYIYDILSPTVDAQDETGSVVLTITPPVGKPSASNDNNISSEPRVDDVWHQDRSGSSGETLKNYVDQIGVMIEVKIGDGKWMPLKAKDVSSDGFKALPSTSTDSTSNVVTVSIPTTEPWVVHAYRACMVVKATAYEFDTALPATPHWVLVHVGDWKWTDESADASSNWADLTKRLSSEDPDEDLMKKFINKQFITSEAVTSHLKEGERAFKGDFGYKPNFIPTSDVRFAFLGIKEGADGDPKSESAEFLITKFIKDSNDHREWLKAPLPVLIKLNEPLQLLKQPIPDPVVPGDKMIEDFVTPFKVTNLEKSVPRIEFYNIRAVSRPGVPRERDLELEKPRQSFVPVVTLTDKDGHTYTYAGLARRINAPRRGTPSLSEIYPFFKPGYSEIDEFKNHASTFHQWPLEPDRPVQYKVGDPNGPMAKYQSLDIKMETDTPYFEFPDGRLVYWESINHRLKVFIEPGSEAALDPKKYEEEEPKKPASETKGKPPEPPSVPHVTPAPAPR